MSDDAERIVQALNEQQRLTILGIGGIGERITVRTDDGQLFEELGLAEYRDGILHLTELGERVAVRLKRNS